MRFDGLVVSDREDAARDPRLIRHHDRRDLSVIDALDGCSSTGKQTYLFRRFDVMRVFHEGAVAVEKDRVRNFLHARAFTIAAVRAAASRAITLRMSSSNRPPAMRPMTAGSPFLSRSSNTAASSSIATA